VLGAVALGLGHDGLAAGLAVAAAAVLVTLALSLRWLMAAGFSPFWGAFTFPLAAAATLWLSLGGPWRIPGGLALVAATLFIPWVAGQVLRLWAKGQLGPKTNAAVA
jgi:tellurite resistance protein